MNLYDAIGFKPVITRLEISKDSSVDEALENIAVLNEAGIDSVLLQGNSHSVDNIAKILGNYNDGEVNFGIGLLPYQSHITLDLANTFNANFIVVSYTNENFYEDSISASLNGIPIIGSVVGNSYQVSVGMVINGVVNAVIKETNGLMIPGIEKTKRKHIAKLKRLRKEIGDYHLIISGGITVRNIYRFLEYSNGVVVDVSFSDKSLDEKLRKDNIKSIVNIANIARSLDEAISKTSSH